MLRRYGRRGFTLAAAVSLVLLAAVVVLWLRGRSVGDIVILARVQPGPPRTTRFLLAWSAVGGLRVMLATQTEAQPLGDPVPIWSHGSYDPGPSPYPVSRPGDGVSRTAGGFDFFRLDYAIPTYSFRQRSITAPTW